MGDRIKLHEMLLTISDNVYFQPPSTMAYPCIKYSTKNIDKVYANCKIYGLKKAYDVTVIDKNPESIISGKVLILDNCKFDRQFVSGGLNHTTFTIYY